MKDLILIKLGGSVITNKKKFRTPRLQTISRLSKEISSAILNISEISFIIATGGGSFSHPVAAKYEVQKGFINSQSLKGMALDAFAEVQINQIVMKYLLSAHIPAISFGPRSFVFGEKGKVKRIFEDAIREALKKGIVSVVYGDMLVDTKLGCMTFSGEQVMVALAKSLKQDFNKITIINCGKTDGVYDDKGETIPIISHKNFPSLKKFITGSDGIDVTGGMIHKVKESLSFVKECKATAIIMNGNKKNNLYNVICGKKTKSTIIKDD